MLLLSSLLESFDIAAMEYSFVAQISYVTNVSNLSTVDITI